MNIQTEIAVRTLRNVVKELILRADKYGISQARIKTLTTANLLLEKYPEKIIDGYIDISANTHINDGSLDYASFTLRSNGIEVYTGYVSYVDGICDESTWEKVFDSNDSTHRNNLATALDIWAEKFLLHLDAEPQRALLVIDRCKLLEEL